MAGAYSLNDLIADLDRITRNQDSDGQIVASAKPLLAQLVRQPECLDSKFKKRGDTAYGRYMLHRAPRFNITAISGVPATRLQLTITTPGASSVSSKMRFKRHAFVDATTAHNLIMPSWK